MIGIANKKQGMTVETKITFRMYLGLIYNLTYRKPITIVLSILGFGMFFGSILYFIGFNMPTDSPPFLPLAFGLLTLSFPIAIYRSSKKTYMADNRLNNRITYQFTDEKIIQDGGSFKSEADWTQIHKVVELSRWILIYSGLNSAYVIPKESFGETLHEFRALVKRTGVKARLRK